MRTTTSEYATCYRCEIYLTERSQSLEIDVTHFLGMDFNSGTFNIWRRHIDDNSSKIYLQFHESMLKNKSFINFAVRKMIYDALVQWHPKWNRKNVLKTIQEQCFTKDVKNYFGNSTKVIYLKFET